ncbi:MAG: hypothetical protein CMD18_07610 [Flavobacteriales bacterium]|nr:hypothetical protein [Flavobacteriales bacterium]
MPNNKKIALYFFYAGLCGLSISISVSKFGTSLGMILLSFAWFLEWNWKEKIFLFKKNKLILLLSISLFLIFVLGLLHSQNIDYAMNDLKIKAPIMILPVIFGLSNITLDRNKIMGVLILFSASAVIASIIGFISYQIELNQGVVLDLRSMSPFISLIRLSLILCFGYGFSLWGISVLNSKFKWILLLFIIWIIYFFIVSQSLTGIVLLPVISIYFLFFVLKKDLKLAISLCVIILGLLTRIGIEIKEISTLVLSSKDLKIKKTTLNGRKYEHALDVPFRENGHLIYDNYCEKEMRQEWNKISAKKYDHPCKGFNYSAVLIRYLSSRGLGKDSVGVSKLSQLEIDAIQNGVTNVYYINRNPLFKRIHIGFMEVMDAYQFKRYSGRSIASRFIYAATGYQIFKDNFWFGVGTGDVKDAFVEQYKKNRLFQKYCDKRSHNQFITIALSEGLFGIVLFVGCLVLLYKRYMGSLNYLFILGQTILLISMLWEDTLETQAGVAIFSLLLNLFLFETKSKNPIPS